MKKTCMLMLIFAVILFPVATHAGLSRLSEKEMDHITGQYGISIMVVDVQQDIYISAITWGDTNGGTDPVMGSAVKTAPGYLNVNNVSIVKATTTLSGSIQVRHTGTKVQPGIAATIPSIINMVTPIIDLNDYHQKSSDNQDN